MFFSKSKFDAPSAMQEQDARELAAIPRPSPAQRGRDRDGDGARPDFLHIAALAATRHAALRERVIEAQRIICAEINSDSASPAARATSNALALNSAHAILAEALESAQPFDLASLRREAARASDAAIPDPAVAIAEARAHRAENALAAAQAEQARQTAELNAAIVHLARELARTQGELTRLEIATARRAEAARVKGA